MTGEATATCLSFRSSAHDDDTTVRIGLTLSNSQDRTNIMSDDDYLFDPDALDDPELAQVTYPDNSW